MYKPKCFVFPDGDDWIVFAPASRLVMRTNAAAAAKFKDLIDEGRPEDHPSAGASKLGSDGVFAPVNVTIACSNRCGQKCVYCYGTPAHENTSTLNPDFCRAGMHYMASHAPAGTRVLRAFFHGVGEPLFFWPLFTECLEIVRRTGREYSLATYINLCTGGQVDAEKADWLCEHIDGLQLSLDGPRDIQNVQRPRRDGRDSFDGPFNLAKRFAGTGKELSVKSTVTSISVARMSEIVEFVAGEIKPKALQLGMMFAPSWVDTSHAQPPALEHYVQGFGAALRRGRQLGLAVQHPSVSLELLCAPDFVTSETHFCLAPPDIVTAYYDVPKEGSSDPMAGVYGWYDEENRTVCFDHEKRKAMMQDRGLDECDECPCHVGCFGTAGVKGRMPDEEVAGKVKCRARMAVLQEMLRQVVPHRMAEEKCL